MQVLNGLTDAAGVELGGSAYVPEYASGLWYRLSPEPVQQGGSLSSGSIRLLPIIIRKSVTIDLLATRVSTASAGGSFQLAIYAAGANSRLPTGTPVATTANLSTAVATMITTPLVQGQMTLAPGLYWVAIVCDNGTARFEVGGGNSSAYASFIAGGLSLADMAPNMFTGSNCLKYPIVYGSGWPDLSAVTFQGDSPTNANMPYMKVA